MAEQDDSMREAEKLVEKILDFVGEDGIKYWSDSNAESNIVGIIAPALRKKEDEIQYLKDSLFMCKTDQYGKLMDEITQLKGSLRIAEQTLEFYSGEIKNKRAIEALQRIRQNKGG